MNKSVKPVVGLTALLILAIIVGNFVPPVVPFAESGQGCYCHNAGIALSVNNTDVATDLLASGFVVVESGGSFILNIRTQRMGPREGVVQVAMGWIREMADNAKFNFDPEEVKDNSLLDQDPSDGSIVTVFKIIPPNDAGPYVISLSSFGVILTLPVTVELASSEAPVPEYPAPLLPIVLLVSMVCATVMIRRRIPIEMSSKEQSNLLVTRLSALTDAIGRRHASCS
jgi:hypothetical protein